MTNNLYFIKILEMLCYICRKSNKMKNLFLVLAVIFSGSIAQAQTKVGTIDAEYILQQMPEMEQVKEGITAYNKQLQDTLQGDIKQYEALVAEYQKNNTTYTEEEKVAKETEIIALENDIKNFRQKASVLIQIRNNELAKPLYMKIDEAMQAVIKEGGFTHIWNGTATGLAFADARFDITETVMAKMGLTVKTE